MPSIRADLLTEPEPLRDVSGLPTVAEACDLLFGRVAVRLDVHEVPLLQSQNRVCAADVRARIDWPIGPTALLDGVAVSHAQALGHRGADGCPVLPPDRYASVPLGGPLCEPYDTVMPLGSCAFCLDGSVVLESVPPRGANVMAAGERVSRDQTVLRKGMRMNPERIAMLRFCGVETVPLLRKPRVAVLTVGERLRRPGEELDLGESYESMGLYAAALFTEANADPRVLPAYGASVEELVRAFKEAAVAHDLVVVVGGCGVHGEDYGDATARALFEAGTVVTRGINLGPGGERVVFAEVRGTPFVAVSGSPRIAVLQLSTLVAPLMSRMLGVPGGDLPMVRVRLMGADGPIVSSGGPFSWEARSVHVERRGYSDLVATVFSPHDMLGSLSTANGMAYVPREPEEDGRVLARLRCTLAEIRNVPKE